MAVISGRGASSISGSGEKEYLEPEHQKKMPPQSHFPEIFSIKACTTMENMPFSSLNILSEDDKISSNVSVQMIVFRQLLFSKGLQKRKERRRT